jgi:hypothetical protein
MSVRRLTASAAVALMLSQVQAAEPLPTKLTGAALFKNGLALVSREAVAPGAGEWLIEDLPAPVHGSLWVGTPAGVKLLSAVAVKSARHQSAPARTLSDLLRANLGRRVAVKTADGWLDATIKALPEAEMGLLVAPAQDNESGGRYWAPAWRGPRPAPPTEAPGFVILETAQGQMALDPNDIHGLRGPALLTTVQREEPGVGLRLKVDGGGPLQVSYLAYGLTWAPSYRLAPGGDSAHLELKATVLNDIEDLAGTTLDFITGYPNVRFARTADPLALTADVAGFLTNLSQPENDGRRGVVAQQMVMANSAAVGPPMGTPLEQPAGGAKEDLFFYPQPGVTLAKGERAFWPVLAADVPCRSLHTWALPDSLEGGRFRPNPWEARPDDDRGIEPPEVWRVLRLKNTTAMPWTTAPVLIAKDDRVLGQDILYYTGVGRETDVRVTRAVDLATSAEETETKREPNAENFDNRVMSRVTVRGVLRLTNGKAEPAAVEITKTLSGELQSSTPSAASRKLGGGLRLANPRWELRWEVTVPPGETTEITYVFTVLI